MKALFLILIAGIAAQAQTSYDLLSPKRVVLSAKIEKITQVEGENELWPQAGTTGEIVIDRRMKTVSINLVNASPQDPTFSTPVAQVLLQLDRYEYDAVCKIKKYYASTSQMANSLTYAIVEVTDYSESTCPTTFPIADTVINYSLSSRTFRPVNYTIFMDGTTLTRQTVDQGLNL